MWRHLSSVSPPSTSGRRTTKTFAASHAIDRPSFKWFFSSSFRPQKRKEKPLRKTSLTHAETTVTNRLFVLFDRSIVFLFPSLFKLSILLTCCFFNFCFVFVVLFFLSRTVWIGVMQLSGSWLWAPLVVALCRRKSTRLTAVLGGLVLALAALFASFAQQIHQVFLR